MEGAFEELMPEPFPDRAEDTDTQAGVFPNTTNPRGPHGARYYGNAKVTERILKAAGDWQVVPCRGAPMRLISQ